MPVRAIALALSLVALWAIIILGCVGVRMVKLLVIKRKEEYKYFARLAKRHRGRARKALPGADHTWMTPTPPNSPKPSESVFEQLVDWYRTNGAPPESSDASRPALAPMLDPAQVETLLAFAAMDVLPEGLLGAQLRLNKAEKAASQAKGGLNADRAARLSKQQLKLGTSALKTWLENSAIAVRVADDVTESARGRVLEEETFTDRLSGRKEKTFDEQQQQQQVEIVVQPNRDTRFGNSYIRQQAKAGIPIQQAASAKLPSTPRKDSGMFKSHRGGEATRDRPERAKAGKGSPNANGASPNEPGTCNGGKSGSEQGRRLQML